MYVVRRRIENLYLVRERDRRRTREHLALLVAALLPALILFAAVWANLETVKLGYAIDGLLKQREALQQTNRLLKTERASLASLERIERKARAGGLAPPRPDQVLYVHDGRLAPLSGRAPDTPSGPANTAEGTSP